VLILNLQIRNHCKCLENYYYIILDNGIRKENYRAARGGGTHIFLFGYLNAMGTKY